MDSALGQRMIDFLQSSKTSATVFYPSLYVHKPHDKVSFQREIDSIIDARRYIAQFISPKFLPEKITDQEKRLAYLDVIKVYRS